MSDADAPDSSIVEKLKKFLTKYGTELLKPYDFPEELMKRLDKLEHLLSNTLQEYKKQVETFLQPSKEALITEDLIRHSQLDIRVSVASCISQIIRITAPDEPYGEDHMKEFFQIANSAFERLPCMYGRVYSKAVSILHTMSRSQSCVMMLDLGLYAAVDHMFHLFLDGIRTKHPNEVFTSMEKIMTSIIHNNVDNDEFSLVLVKILVNNLRRENQNVAPVSFKLAGNTLKNCSADLKTYLPEAVRSLDVPIEDYAEVVVSLFQDATQRQITDLKDSVENVSCPGEAGLAVEADLCNLIEGNETQNSKNAENYNENQGKAMHRQQEEKPEELHIERKRIRRPSSLRKAEEGYDPFWMLIDWRSMKSLGKKNKNINCPAKTKYSKDSSPKSAVEYIGTSISPKPSKMKKKSERNEGVSADKALEPTSEEMIVVSEDQSTDIIVKSRFEKGQTSGTKVSSVKKGRRNTIVYEDLKEDIVSSSEEEGQGSLTKVSSMKNGKRKTTASEDLKADIVSYSEKGQGSGTKVYSVKKGKRKTIVSEDLKEDIMSSFEEEGQGSMTKVYSVKNGRRKTLVSEDLKEDIVSRSEKEQGSGMKVYSVKEGRKKAVVSEVLKEDIMSNFEEGQGSLTKVSSVKKGRRKTIVSEDLKEDIMSCSEEEEGQGSLINVSSVKKGRRKTIVSKGSKEDTMSRSKKGQWSGAKVYSVKKAKRMTIVSEDLKVDIVSSSEEEGQGPLPKVSSVKKGSRIKTIISDDFKEDIVSHSKKGQGSGLKVYSVKKGKRKTIVSEDLKEDIMSNFEEGQGSMKKVSSMKKGRINTTVSSDLKEDIMSISEEEGQGFLTKVSSVKKGRRKTIVSKDSKEDTVSGSEKGQGSGTKVSSVMKRKRKAIVSEDLKEDIMSSSEDEVKKGKGKTIVFEDLKKDIVSCSKEEGQGSLRKVYSVKKCRGKTIVSEDLKEDIVSRSEKGQDSWTKVSSVKKSKRMNFVSVALKEEIMSCSEEEGQGSLKKVSFVKKGKKETVVSEDLKEDIVSHSEKGQGSLTKIYSVKKGRGKTIVSEDLKEDIVSRSEKGQGSLTKVSSVKKGRRKTIVSEDLKEDIMTLASHCSPMSSQAKAGSVEVSKQNPKGSMPRLRKRTASGSVGEEVVGCRIKVWWPLDQTFYKGTIMAFDPLYQTHQVDYDDGEIEILDLTEECWELLQDSNLSADESEIGAAPSSTKVKLV